MIYDLLRLADSFEKTSEFETVMVLITSLLSHLINFVSPQLQRVFIGSFDRYIDTNSEADAQVLVNLSAACVKLSRSNGESNMFSWVDFYTFLALLPIFSPSWDTRGTYAVLGQPSIGSLVYAIDSCVEKTTRLNSGATVVEMCLYLIWHHSNLYIKLLDKTDENRLAVERLKENAPNILTDPFFSKVQTTLQVSS